MAVDKGSLRMVKDCQKGHGFGQCLGDVEAEARENPSWLAAMINHAALTKPDIRQQL